MNYYPLNIGDYLAHTCHLTHMEDLAYFRLINLYYLNESPIEGTVATIAKSIRMNDNATEIQYVLNEFFIEEDGRWLNKRCDKEISIYKSKQNQSSLAGIASGVARRNARSTGAEQTLNQTRNSKQETINKKDSTPLKLLSINYKIPKQTAKDYIALRNKKNAPVTATSMNLIQKEAEKAGISLEAALKLCIENSWRGFKSDWLKAVKEYGKGSQGKTFDWRSSENGVKAKGVELKIYPNIGESLDAYKQRLLRGER